MLLTLLYGRLLDFPRPNNDCLSYRHWRFTEFLPRGTHSTYWSHVMREKNVSQSSRSRAPRSHFICIFVREFSLPPAVKPNLMFRSFVLHSSERPVEFSFSFVTIHSSPVQCLLSPNARLWTTVLDSGVYTVDSRFQILDSGFFVTETWISDSNR